jgi:hypothetical protein
VAAGSESLWLGEGWTETKETPPLGKGDIGGFLRGSVGDIHNGIMESRRRTLAKKY